MQLHVCLLLFIITTADKSLAFPDHRCGGNLSLDQEPAGLLSLVLPGLPTAHRSDVNPAVCTWFVDVPVGRALRVTLAEPGSGSSVWLRCVGSGEDHDLVLETGREALLSGCDRNKAALTWTGTGRSSLQLAYVQEDQRNSSEGGTTHRPGRGLVSWSPTETMFTRTAPVSQDVVRGIEGVRGRLYEGWGRSQGPWPVSGQSWEGQGSLQPTTPLRGLALAERTDGETLPLPEEATNNGADTSGSARPTDSPVSAREATSSSVHTQHTLSTDTSDTWSAETKSGTELAQTQMASTAAAASNSDAALAPGKQQHAHAAATASSSSLQALSSSPPPPPPSPPPPPPPTTWGAAALLITHGGAFGEGTRPHSWTGANTNTFSSDLTSTVTSDPVTSHSDPLQHDSGSAHAGTAAAASASPPPWTSSAHAAAGPTATAASRHPNTNCADSSESATSGAVSQTVAAESSDRPDDASELRAPTSSTTSRANLRSTASIERSSFTETSTDTYTTTQGHVIYTIRPAASSPPGVATVTDEASGSAASSSALGPDASTAADLQSSSTSVPSSTSMSTASHPLHTHSASTPSVRPPHTHTHYETRPVPAEPSTAQHTSSHAPHRPQSPSSTHEPHNFSRAARVPPLAHTTKKPEEGGDVWRRLPSNTTTHTPTAGPPPPTSNPLLSSTSSQPPKYYIVPDQPAAIKAETVELLLQIILEDSGSVYAAGLEEDAAAWVRPYLQKAPGFSRLLGVWGGGHAVQNLVEFRTSGALQWLGRTGPASLLERTGLAQAVREATSLRTSRITNITVGGQQGEVCDWLLQCPPGYACASQPDRTNYSCSSLCHLDHCHHHGICTHHPGQLPVCRCLVGESFWYMGQRCDVRMTRARLVGACLAILLIIVTVIGVLAVVAVRRYRAVLIQAKVDQTRSSYRRFNHFDELSGRFWLRSWAGSADSMDNPAFTRSDELLHLRALDRPCCYHDDTLSLASTCPSHGTRVNTIYPHSSQYAWRGSELSVGDGVLDSGKASDLSVCSWPVEPIQWTPFPLLQRLSSHRTPPVRAPRPRSYCEGMELVDLEKSWTA